MKNWGNYANAKFGEGSPSTRCARSGLRIWTPSTLCVRSGVLGVNFIYLGKHVVSSKAGGEGRIWTFEGVSRLIYSQMRLTTSLPLHTRWRSNLKHQTSNFKTFDSVWPLSLSRAQPRDYLSILADSRTSNLKHQTSNLKLQNFVINYYNPKSVEFKMGIKKLTTYSLPSEGGKL